jgi:hypothetical protein
VKVYLDMCSLKRPFDDQNQSRTWIETQAVIRILDAFHRGRCAVVNSDALLYENSRNPKPVRRNRVGVLLNSFGRPVAGTAAVTRRAIEIRSFGIPDMDALHLAMAEKAGCVYFITCDEALLRRTRHMEMGLVVTSPTVFVEENDV